MPDLPPTSSTPRPRRTRRPRVTRRSVLVIERVASALITAGGLGTIIAVSSILLFLLWVVAPLFRGVRIEDRQMVPWSAGEILASGMDEEGLLVWDLAFDGTLRLSRVDDGETLSETRPFGDAVPSAVSISSDQQHAACGFPDGTIRLGRIGFAISFLDPQEETPALARLEEGETLAWGPGLVERTKAGQLRATFPELVLNEPLDTQSTSAIRRIDQAVTPSGPMVAALHDDDSLRIYRVRSRKNLLTQKVTRSLQASAVPFEARSGEDPAWIGVSGLGIDLFVLFADGILQHFDLRDASAPVLLETRDVVPETDRAVTRASFLLGRRSILVGDSGGRAQVWFPVRSEAGGDEGSRPLVAAQKLVEQGPAIRSVANSSRSRVVAIGRGDGSVLLFYVTSGHRLASLATQEEAVDRLVLSPKENLLLARAGGEGFVWRLDLGYPEANFAGLFQPVQYEGYTEPAHVWQSSSGTDDFEPKLGMMPLVFGTLKATLYSMLFGAPLALLAAIYSSEFLAPRVRTRVKAFIELMAGLPSVVLGFVAALVIAPFVEGILAEVLTSVYTVPFVLLLGAYLWQLLPASRTLRMSGWPRLIVISLCIPLGVGLGILLGPLVESALFAGDLPAWLDGRAGSGAAGWFFLLIPAAILLAAFVAVRVIGPRLRARSVTWDRRTCARADLAKFGLLTLLTLAVAGSAALLLSFAGFDPRGDVVGTYVQRNAMVVGFVMGFAIIPIIYTLSEDALSEVPAHLREGSLGAGATLWQTAIRIVIPAAMSGLFSALMIGLGRAVGETMIVLMAAGNTPIMDFNIFNGFRTLSANIAVEMPEAVRNSTHYRTLFLAALVLFGMTFVLNTIAEIVRRHFRAKTRAL